MFFAVLGFLWQEADCSLFDGTQKAYVKKWNGSKCRFDAVFAFKSPYQALQWSGKMLDYLRLRFSIRPSKCEMTYAKDTIRVNAWKSDLRM